MDMIAYRLLLNALRRNWFLQQGTIHLFRSAFKRLKHSVVSFCFCYIDKSTCSFITPLTPKICALNYYTMEYKNNLQERQVTTVLFIYIQNNIQINRNKWMHQIQLKIYKRNFHLVLPDRFFSAILDY